MELCRSLRMWYTNLACTFTIAWPKLQLSPLLKSRASRLAARPPSSDLSGRHHRGIALQLVLQMMCWMNEQPVHLAVSSLNGSSVTAPCKSNTTIQHV